MFSASARSFSFLVATSFKPSAASDTAWTLPIVVETVFPCLYVGCQLIAQGDFFFLSSHPSFYH